MAKIIQKKTEGACAVKVYGNGVTETIGLKTELNKANETVADTVHVDISGITWTGDGTAIITVTRNSVVIATLNTNTAGELHFEKNGMVPETLNATYDIVVQITGGEAQCWLRLKKVGGYTSTHSLLTGIQP